MPRPSKTGAIMPGEKPAAPDRLREDMREEWKKIVAAMPVGWFKPEMLPLLEEHVRTIVYCREVGAELDRIDVAKLDEPGERKRYNWLSSKYFRLTTLMVSFAHKLRLTAQAQRRPTMTGPGPGVTERPWSN
jgi:hypothetical protein